MGQYYSEMEDSFITPTRKDNYPIKPIAIHLIRHAESKVNATKCITGSLDVELSDKGKWTGITEAKFK